MNSAETDLWASIVSWHVDAEPEQSPPHPVKVEPDEALAVSVTTVPAVNEAPHVTPQEIPAGDELTVPVPVPVRLTDAE